MNTDIASDQFSKTLATIGRVFLYSMFQFCSNYMKEIEESNQAFMIRLELDIKVSLAFAIEFIVDYLDYIWIVWKTELKRYDYVSDGKTHPLSDIDDGNVELIWFAQPSGYLVSWDKMPLESSYISICRDVGISNTSNTKIVMIYRVGPRSHASVCRWIGKLTKHWFCSGGTMNLIHQDKY